MLNGIGFYIWKVESCEGGNVDAIVKKAVESRFSHVLVKIADGVYSYNAVYVEALTRGLRAAGIEVFGWQYVYGANPSDEALRVIPIIQALELDGFVVNAEVEYKRVGSAARAKLYMQTLRARVGADLPIALSTYRWPTYHPEFPFDAFLESCDLAMPQVYWMQEHNPTAQLKRTVSEYAALAVKRPVFPTGACFREYGWQPTAVEVGAFIQAAKDLGLAGVNFWEWANARAYVADGWEVIRSAGWATTPAPEPEPTPVSGQMMRVLVDGLRVRSTPVADPSGENVTGRLAAGQLVRIATTVNKEIWVELAEGGYAAVLVNGTRYMEAVE